MIDTIWARPVHGAVLEANEELKRFIPSPTAPNFPGFSFSSLSSSSYGPSRLLRDEDSGLQITSSNQSNPKIKVSLPRLLHSGGNFRLITCDHEIQRAQSLLKEKVEKAFISMPPLEFRRVDLVLQFWIDCAAVLKALKSHQYPQIRQSPTEWESASNDHSLQFKGKEMTIGAYDKMYHMLKNCRGDKELYEQHRGKVLRVEFLLKGNKLKKLLSDGENYPTHLDFNRCYQEYRKLLLGFEKVTTQKYANKTHFILDLIARTSKAGVTMDDGRSPLDHWEDFPRSNSTCRAHRALMRKTLLESVCADWGQLVPEIWSPTNKFLVQDFEALEARTCEELMNR